MSRKNEAHLWAKKDSVVKDAFDKSLSNNNNIGGKKCRKIIFKKGSATGQKSKSYVVKIAETFHKNTKAILYFPKNPKKPLFRVNSRSHYDKTQLLISEYLRESNGGISENTVKIVLWVNDEIYHCTNLDKTLEFRWCDRIRFDNKNKFNDVLTECPMLIQTDGECRIEFLVALVPHEAIINDTHVKHNMAILTTSQIFKAFWPTSVRHVADADPRVRRRVLPQTATEKDASAITNVMISQEDSEMRSIADDIFGSDSEEDVYGERRDDDNDNNNNNNIKKRRNTSYEEGEEVFMFDSSYTDVTDTELLEGIKGKKVTLITEEDRKNVNLQLNLAFDDIDNMSAEEDYGEEDEEGEVDKGKGEEND